MANELKMADKLRILGDRLFNVKNVKIIAEEEKPVQRLQKSSPYHPDRLQQSTTIIHNSPEEGAWRQVQSLEVKEQLIQAQFLDNQIEKDSGNAEATISRQERIKQNLKLLNII